MLDSQFWIEALKEYGPIVLILVAIYVLTEIGLLSFAALSDPVSIGNFLAGVGVVLIGIVTYAQNILKHIKTQNNNAVNEMVEAVQETHHKVNESFEMLNNQNSATNQMHLLLMNIHDIVKGIPNKNLIYESLIIRTRYLLNDGLETILEYTITNSTPLPADALTRLQNKLERNLSKLRVDYLDSIMKISNNMLKGECRAELDTLLDGFFSNIYDITTTGRFAIEDALFRINSELKDLEDTLNTIFKRSIDLNPQSGGTN